MRIFEKPNFSETEVCPICKTIFPSPIVLIGVVGTQEGHNIEAKQVHVNCLDLLLDEEKGFIYQRLK